MMCCQSLTWNLLVEGTAWELYFSISIHSVPPSPSPSSVPSFPCLSLSIPCYVTIIYSHSALWAICSCVSHTFSLPFLPWSSLSRAFTKRWNRRGVGFVWSALSLFLLLFQGSEAKKHPNVRLLQRGGLTCLALPLPRWHCLRWMDNGGLWWKH